MYIYIYIHLYIRYISIYNIYLSISIYLHLSIYLSIYLYIYIHNTLNIKNTLRHHGRKPSPLLIYCLRSLQEQFCDTQFLISFLKLFREINIYI